MKSRIQKPSLTLKIGAVRFKTVVAEVREHQRVSVRLESESGVDGVIVLLRPALPCIK